MSAQRYDLLIVGGGMVGASLALALQHSGLRIAVVEAVAMDDGAQPSFDARAIALSHGSRQILDGMGLWSAMAAATVTPITDIRVSDRGHFGAVRMTAREEGVAALGYVVEAAVIGRVFNAALKQAGEIELFCPATVNDIQVHGDLATVEIMQQGESRRLQTRLLIAADGGQSAVAAQLGGSYVNRPYGQSAVIANVIGSQTHDGIAYERFTDSGPLALLPNCAPQWMAGSEAGERRWSLVWTVHNEQVDEHLALDDEAFLARLQQRLGRRAGRMLAVGPRRAYPLALRYLRDHVRERVVFIGNAAHTIHPVAGQGLNLGLRDVAALAEVIENAARAGQDIGTLSVLEPYAKWRRADYLRVMAATDTLARGFLFRLAPVVVGRNLGMIGMDLLPPARRLLTRQMMGLAGRQSRLARGFQG
jgi:2-octaprenyl-6-methoxyphenol hydroxylase